MSSLGSKRKEHPENEHSAEKKARTGKEDEIIWRTIPEAPLYEMSNTEQVRNKVTKQLLKKRKCGTWGLVRDVGGDKINHPLSHSRLFYTCFPEIVDGGKLWKQIQYFSNYEVSEDGKVRGPNKKLLKSQDHNGYNKVKLKVGKKSKAFFVHTLVSLTFIGPRPSPRHSVNHKNALKKDNRVENLEWASPADQVKHAVENKLVGGPNSNSRKIKQLDLTGTLMQVHNSLFGAARAVFYKMNAQTVGNVATNIQKACNGECRTYAGYLWEYDTLQKQPSIPENPNEEWKTCAIAPIYEVSNMGNLRNIKTGRSIAVQMNTGYLRVDLRVDSKNHRFFRVHRLVATAFIMNDDPTNKTVVDHINGDKSDNRAVNLQYLTPQKNTEKGCGRKIAKIDHLGNVMAIYPSIRAAARAHNFVLSTFETHVRKDTMHGGFQWRDAKDDDVVMNSNDFAPPPKMRT